MTWDAAVIGAGVVGVACARRLSLAGLRVVVLEREARPGRGTTSRNSGVIHAGMYYPTGSRKAALCVAGNRALSAYCRARAVPHAIVGKLIVATDLPGEAALETILAQGRDNGVERLARVDPAFVRAREPNVRCRAALWSPNTGIVDAHALVDALAADARAAGADFAMVHSLEAVERSAGTFRLRIVDPSGERVTLEVARVVNAAGLAADEVAACAGIDVDAAGYRQWFVKGNYFRLRRPQLVRGLVYPVPEAALSGLGIHVTVELDGGAKLGPDVEPIDGRTPDYAVDETRAERFFRAASTYLEGLAIGDLLADQAGLRPKLSRPFVRWAPGEPARDFVIAEESPRGLPGLVDLVGIESPGLTCALPIADEVAKLLEL
jgi:L-2-hydroxyglutarate oxidase LhgO